VFKNSNSSNHLSSTFLIGNISVWTQDLALGRQMFCHLSHVLVLLWFRYFPYRGWCPIPPPRARLRLKSPVYWLRWGLAKFFPELGWNLDPPDLQLPNSWDYRNVPSHLALPGTFSYARHCLMLPQLT
jgi:hypothetical protein